MLLHKHILMQYCFMVESVMEEPLQVTVHKFPMDSKIRVDSL
ncbi:hypothetical protein AHF37_05702 [Paragonimus kellicotti]|nr:hypothetical protein AHF37_05702 [Paragonimus kellicotti]